MQLSGGGSVALWWWQCKSLVAAMLLIGGGSVTVCWPQCSSLGAAVFLSGLLFLKLVCLINGVAYRDNVLNAYVVPHF